MIVMMIEWVSYEEWYLFLITHETHLLLNMQLDKKKLWMHEFY
jgi:hypothetical protein